MINIILMIKRWNTLLIRLWKIGRNQKVKEMTKTELKQNITNINKLLRSDSYEVGIELLKTLDNPEIKKGTAKVVAARIKKFLKQRDDGYIWE